MLPIYTLGLRIFLVNEKDYNCHNCPLQIYSPPLAPQILIILEASLLAAFSVRF